MNLLLSLCSLSFYNFRIIDNWFLTMATFFDPRFQSQTTKDEQNQIRVALEKHCTDAKTSTAGTSSSVKTEANKKYGKFA